MATRQIPAPKFLNQTNQLTASPSSSALSKPPASLNSSRLSLQGKSPYELAYMRRICVREQKRSLITRKLEDDLPVNYMIMHCFILIILAILFVSIQIALIVYQSPLFYICSGFWVGAYFVFCAVLTAFLIYKRSYNVLMSCFILHGLGIAICLGGIVVVNGMDLSIYNTTCMIDCASAHQHQYLALIQLVFGICGVLVFALFVLIVEISILRESRLLDAYLQNPPNK